jgi:hypothetical protein
MSYLKQKLLAAPLVRYGALTLASGLWLFGLIEQLHSSTATVKYMLLSLLIAAVAFIG